MAGTSLCSFPNERNKTEEDDIFWRFQTKFLKENPEFVNYLFGLNDALYALCAYRIRSCNAAEPAFGIGFTDALCALNPDDKMKYAFGNFFIDTFKMMKKISRDSVKPEDPILKFLLCKLLKFLINFEETTENPLFDMECLCENETELAVLLSCHFFSELSISPTYTIDNSKGIKPKRCPCGKIHQSVCYGDTSIGNPDVWHGQLDVIMEAAEVGITLENNKCLANTDSTTEVKPKNVTVNDVSVGGTISKIAAETIVHSFLYRKNHSWESNSLVPCIGVCDNDILFYFYDSVNDVLLGSHLLPLFPKGKTKDNIQTIIATWLVLNHKYLCNGLARQEQDLPKAGFFELCKDKLEIYKNKLKKGNVAICTYDTILDPLEINTRVLVHKEFESM